MSDCRAIAGTVRGLRFASMALAGIGATLAQSSWITPLHPPERKGEALMLRGFYLTSSIARPDITIECRDGRLVSAKFDTSIETGKAGGKSVVAVRIGEGKEKAKLWKVADNSKSLKADSGFVAKLLAADRVQIAFPTVPSGSMTAEFRPSRSDVPRIRRACGLP